MKVIGAVLLVFFLGTFGYSQYESGVTIPDVSRAIHTDTNDIQVRLANTITVKDLYKHLSTLASDAYEGRETGEKGNYMAAAYLANHLDSMGVAEQKGGGYYQAVDFTNSTFTETAIRVGNEKYKYLWDYLAFPSRNRDLGTMAIDEVTYLGYGIEEDGYNNYRKGDINGKVIMIHDGLPTKRDGTPWLSEDAGQRWTTEHKLAHAQEKGAKMVLVIVNDIKKMLGENRRKLLGYSMEMGDFSDNNIKGVHHVYISSTMAREIIGKKASRFAKRRKKAEKCGKFKPLALKTDMDIQMEKKVVHLEGYNVLGFIEGRDPKLKKEIVVVSAHYDHLGKRGDDIYNGADDNASGTSTILEIAEAFSIAKKMGQGPRRSVLFLWVTGEEKGLLGSEYFSDFPIYPLEDIIADVNVDMVGRVDKKYTDNPNYIYVIGSDRLSSDLHRINEEMNQKYTQLTLDYKYNSEDDPNKYYFRSDHYNFAKNGIPSVFFFNGTHEDYHRITDTVEKINFEKMEKVGRHIFHTTWELANRDKRIVVDGEIK